MHLLVFSIFSISTKNIIDAIVLFEEYGINKYITNSSLRKDARQQRYLIEYMIKNNIDLLVDDNKSGYKLNTLLNCSNKQLNQKYNIDIKEIEKGKCKSKQIIY